MALLMINVYSFAQNYTWLNGAITYTFPAAITIIYIAYLYKKESFNFGKLETIYLLTLNIITPLFAENIGFAFVTGNIIILTHRILKQRKFSPVFLIFAIVSVTSLGFMLTNPGLSLENSKVAFYSLSLFNKIKTNIPEFIHYVFTNNPLLLIFMLMPINYLLYVKTENYVYSRLMLVLFNLIPLFSIICNFDLIIPVNINLLISKYDGMFLIEKWYFIFYWILFIGLFIYSVADIIPKGRKRDYSLLITIISMVSVISLLLAPTWSCSMVILFVFGIISASCITITELKVKVIPWVTISIVVLLVIYYLAIMTVTFYIHKTRENYIKEQLDSEDKLIYVKANPFYLNWEYNPTCNSANMQHFKKYYNIPEDTIIEVKYLGILGKIEQGVKNDDVYHDKNICR